MDSQRDSADSGRINDLERRLGLVEVRQGAIERSREVMKVVVPAETRRHMRAAWRENLLAVRSLLDTWIDRLTRTGQTAPTTAANRFRSTRR